MAFMLVAFVVLIASCGEPEPTLAPSPAPVLAEAPTATPIPSLTPTASPTPIASPIITPPSVPSSVPTPVPTPPEASFSIDFSSGSAPLIVEFNNTTRGATTSIEWDFGDGTTSTNESPSHRYTISGSYTVQLSVTGPSGSDTFVMTDLITIEPGPPVSIEIVPSSVTLVVQEITKFEATTLDEFGNVSSSEVVWNVIEESGSITDSGVFTANTIAGAFADAVVVSTQSDEGELLATASVTLKPGPVADVTLTPSEVTMDIGGTQFFEVAAFDKHGNKTTDFKVEWSVPPDVGTIDTQGLLTVDSKAGTFLSAILLNVVDGSHTVSVKSDVVILPGPLAAIEVQPSKIVVMPGTDQRFTAAGFDQYGNEISSLTYEWQATGGNIAQDGTFFPRQTSGQYQVNASASFGGVLVVGLANVVVPISCSDVSELSTQECQSLVSLFNDTGGSNWTNSDQWLANFTPCSWYGITCRDGHVIRILLEDNQLSGSIPAELGSLSELTNLRLDNNQLIGSIPAELGDLSHLKWLRLEQNQLSGSIPGELGRLSELSFLFLWSNELTGSIPKTLGNLSSLTSLNLSRNELIGSIPAELGDLSDLDFLVLSFNQLRGSIPAELGGLPRLKELKLDSNQLSGSITGQLGDLGKLILLNISGNDLSGSIPLELMSLNLSTFNFSDTILCEPLDAAFQAWLDAIDELQSTEVKCVRSGA